MRILGSNNQLALEVARIRLALVAHRGDMSKVAASIGVARTTLYRKLKKRQEQEDEETDRALEAIGSVVPAVPQHATAMRRRTFAQECLLAESANSRRARREEG